MTEQEWLMCAEPKPMLEFLQGKASDRKLRLFAIACCRYDWGRLIVTCRNTVEVAERFADGKASAEELAQAKQAAWVIWTHERIVGSSLRQTQSVVLAADEALSSKILTLGESYMRVEWPILSDMIGDLFGNPFRQVVIDPAWRTPTVTSLAQAFYDDRDFTRMPILGDDVP